jgi:hypothetical protein
MFNIGFLAVVTIEQYDRGKKEVEWIDADD